MRRDNTADINAKVSHEEPDIQFSDYALAYEWNKLEKDVKQVKFNGEIIYCTPAVDEKKKSTQTIACSIYNVMNGPIIKSIANMPTKQSDASKSMKKIGS